MLFWHVGGTVAAIRYAFRDDRIDLRFLLLGAVIPDLVDTPIGLLWFDTFGSVRLVAHSILFGSLVMAVVVLNTRRGRPRKKWMPLAIGILMHLVLDAMWIDPEDSLVAPLWRRFYVGGRRERGGSYSGGVDGLARLGSRRCWCGLPLLSCQARKSAVHRGAQEILEHRPDSGPYREKVIGGVDIQGEVARSGAKARVSDVSASPSLGHTTFERVYRRDPFRLAALGFLPLRGRKPAPALSASPSGGGGP